MWGTSKRNHVFISWSGWEGWIYAQLFRRLFNKLFGQDRVNTFVSADISPGASYFGVIKENLETADLGLILLNDAAKDSPWVGYELGKLEERALAGIVPVVVNEKTELEDSVFSHLQLIHLDEVALYEAFKLVNKNFCTNIKNDTIKSAVREFMDACVTAENYVVEISGWPKPNSSIDILESIDDRLSTIADKLGIPPTKPPQYYSHTPKVFPYTIVAGATSRNFVFSMDGEKICVGAPGAERKLLEVLKRDYIPWLKEEDD
jgi:TIR domain